ncbi:MAG TPA: TonB-dependent receptor [Bryobacteraceae bacterium]|nr:TonB-dependent receptor [Bryobacteraceae bacterium]
MTIHPRVAGLVALAALSTQIASSQSPAPLPSTVPVNGVKPATAPDSAPLARSRMGASAQRNENVIVFMIDTNAVKEANIRVGSTTTVITDPRAESQYFATEHGSAPSNIAGLRSQPAPSGLHGDAAYSHQNSLFNARTFFQVGGVKPSHRNLASGRLTGPLPGISGFWTATYNQRDIRGMVNGNVLVPLANERTPLATDPAARAIIQGYLDAFPDELPNRPDFDIRALNTNAAQRIDSLAGTGRIDLLLPRRQRLMANYSIDRQRIRAFKFVAGQNPDTDLHTPRGAITWTRELSPGSDISLTASYQRGVSVLTSEPNAVGPRVRFGNQIEELGPDSMFPIDRTVNTFLYGAAFSRRSGAHSITWGGDLTRFRQHGIESNNSRGYLQFQSNLGRTAIENFRLGLPTIYEVALGDLTREFANHTANGYLGDRWQVHSRLQLYLGLRYMADSSPVETSGIDKLPYSGDYNNFSPRLSLAWQAGNGWVVRSMYTTSFQKIPAVAYQQIRNNPPRVQYVTVNQPLLTDLLAGVSLEAGGRYTPTWIAPELATPYSHQYNAAIEKRFGWGGLLRTSYIGSRTFKMLTAIIQNRADPVASIPLTTATVNLRRPDPRYYETYTILNGGVAYFDAGQASLELPSKKGFTGQFTYTFSKAIDEGSDFSATAANQDLVKNRNQWQYESFKDRKGLSNFDSPHAFTAALTYELPFSRAASNWGRRVFGGWPLSSIHLWKKGTPSTLYVGSDSPGYGNVDGGPSDRPNIIDPSILGATISHPDNATRILSRDKFAFIRLGEQRGNLGRGTFRRARIWNWNGSAARRIQLPREWSAVVSGEVYNLSNTPQFDEPQRNLSSPSFGKITNTLNDGRVFQLGFRLIF